MTHGLYPDPDYETLDHGWALVPSGIRERRSYAEQLITSSGIVAYHNFYGLDLLAELLEDYALARQLILSPAQYWVSIVSDPLQPLGYPTAIFTDRGTRTGYARAGSGRDVRIDHERWMRQFYQHMLSFASYQVVLIDWRHVAIRANAL